MEPRIRRLRPVLTAMLLHHGRILLALQVLTTTGYTRLTRQVLTTMVIHTLHTG
jgi:hypothetical protein